MTVSNMMFRPRFAFSLLLLTSLLTHGCTSFMARRAILNFADGLESQDLDQIRVATSRNFESKALRQPEAITDLKLLRFPKGDVRVVTLEAIDENSKMATVEIGEGESIQTVDYRLTLDQELGRWVVDDVILSKDDIAGQEIRRSVTDQMDLLLSCRELLKDWESAPRAVRLKHCTNELHAQLSTLPPNWFEKLTSETVGTGRSVTFRPEARLNGDHAVVVAPHPDGSLFVEYRKELNHWKVQNVAIEPRDESETGVRSLLTLAQTLNHTAKFLTSFADGETEKISAYSTPDFYSQSLANGDLSTISLPVAMLIADDYEANQYKDRTELLLESNGAMYMVTVRTVDLPASEDGKTGLNEPRVDEVTIFEANGAEVKKVSAMLLSTSVVDLYIEALRTRNLEKIRSMSSNDFNERVWRTDAAKYFGIMPYPQIDPGETEVISTVFRGDVTEITVVQGDTPMTMILRLSEGWMVIDDVLLPAQDRPVSLKSNLELILPLQAFASGVNRGDVNEVVRYSAHSLNQKVWRQLNYVPEISRELVRPLMSEVIGIRIGDSEVIVHTSDGMISSEIKMARDGDRYVIHDVSLINEASPTKQFRFLQSVRESIATGRLLPKGAQQQFPVIQAAGTREQPQAGSQIRTATFEPIAPEIYSR